MDICLITESRSTPNRFVLTLPMKAERWQKDRLNRAFRACNSLKNALIARMRKAYREMVRTRKWRRNRSDLLKVYDDLRAAEREREALEALRRRLKDSKKRLSKNDANRLTRIKAQIKELKARKKDLYGNRNEILREYGMSEYSFHAAVTDMRQRYKALIPSHAAQKIASTV